jgi:hypothetical protein
MAKRKPTQVIVHRIELQESEREILRDMALAYNFNRVSQPLVALINDNTTMLLILSAAAAWIGFTYIPPVLEEGVNLLQDFKEQLDHAVEQGTILRERVDFVGESLGRGPLAGIIDMAEAVLGVNLPDFGSGYEPGDRPDLFGGTGGGGGF